MYKQNVHVVWYGHIIQARSTKTPKSAHLQHKTTIQFHHLLAAKICSNKDLIPRINIALMQSSQSLVGIIFYTNINDSN